LGVLVEEPRSNDRQDRPSARVIVLDEQRRILLFRVVDPTDHRDDKPAVWVTPGGGLEAGEELNEAAARELREETGLSVDAFALGSPVARCSGDWEFRGQPYFSEDVFFVLETSNFEPDDAEWTELEREVHQSWRWCAVDELNGLDGVVLPAGLGQLVEDLAEGTLSGPVTLPWLAV